MFLYVFWLRKGPSIKCVRNKWVYEVVIRNPYSCAQGEWEGVLRWMCTYAITLSLSLLLLLLLVFFAAVLFYSFSSYLWKFNLPFIQTWFKKDEFVRGVVLLQQNQFISSRNKLFYLKSFFCEPKLVKTLSVFFLSNYPIYIIQINRERSI